MISTTRSAESRPALPASNDEAKLPELCPVCGARLMARAPIRQMARFRLFECDTCRIQFWDPFKRLEASWYEESYTGRLQTIPPLEPGHKFFLADSRAPKKGRLLDIGCGAGNFMAAARAKGFDVTGIDWDSKAIAKGKVALGLEKIFSLSIEEYAERNSGQTFDVVSFFEVLEHQDDPNGFLKQVQKFMKPGGYIALSVPNRNRWQKGLDFTDLPPNHLTRWNPDVLTAFLQRHEFEVVSCQEEPMSLRRAASMLSSAMPTGLARMVMGGTPPNSTEVAENPDRARATWQRQARFGRNRIASILVHCKNGALLLPALLCWPYLRAKGYPGIYLYCLARWKG